MKYFHLLLIGCCLLLITCMPMINTFETAQTVPVNEFAVGGSVSPYYFSIIRNEGANGTFWPTTRITAKYGVNDNFDLGLGALFTYWIPGLIFNAKYQFQKNDINAAFAFNSSFYRFSLDPFANPNTRSSFDIFNFQPAIVISQDQQNKFPFSMSLGIHHWQINYRGEQSESGTSSLTSLFTNFGIPLRLGANKSVRIMPEIGLMLPILGKVSLFDDEEDVYSFQTGAVFGQFGIYIGK